MRLEDLGRAKCRPQWQRTARNTFRYAQNIRRDLSLLAREEGSSSSPTRHDLVNDQQASVELGDTFELSEQVRWIHSHATRAEHQRLDQQSGNFPAAAELLQVIKRLL